MESRCKIFSNVSENKNGGGGKLTFLHFRIHENAFNITQNALVPQLPGEFARRPPAGTLPPGCTAPIPRFAPFPQHEFLYPPLLPCTMKKPGALLLQSKRRALEFETGSGNVDTGSDLGA